MNAVIELEFNPEEWHLLGSRDRVRRCFAFAQNAKQLSVNAVPELKHSYLELSQHWMALAEEIEQFGR